MKVAEPEEGEATIGFYHVKIESQEFIFREFEFALNLSKDRLISQFIRPYEKDKFIIVNGRSIVTSSISRLIVTQTHEDSGTFIEKLRKSGAISSSEISYSDFINLGEEVTYKFIKGPPGYKSPKKKEQEKELEDQKKHSEYSKKVFIVHGHDEMLKNDMERFVSELGLEPIVLHRQPDKGLTIIEKLEEYSNVGYAFVLLSPDDIGFSVEESQKKEGERTTEFRARQNVIFEFGYLIGKLGRSRVCCIYKQDITLPTDISGLVYKKIEHSIKEVEYLLAKELKEVGYNIRL